jgi:hypothetical protein
MLQNQQLLFTYTSNIYYTKRVSTLTGLSSVIKSAYISGSM